MTALVAKAFFAEHEEETLEMLSQWMGSDGVTLLEKKGGEHGQGRRTKTQFTSGWANL